MNHEVTVKTCLLVNEPKLIKLRALFANCSETTQISERLADRLGLTQFKNIYVQDDNCGGPCLKWKVSLVPIFVSSTVGFQGLPNQPNPNPAIVITYPVVNLNNAFYEMILGMDIFNQMVCTYYAGEGGTLRATGGPGFERNVEYMGHNVSLAPPSRVPKNEWYEYPCDDSTTVERIAIHKQNRELLAKFVGSDVIHRFTDLPKRFEELIEQGGAREEVLAAVREECTESVMEGEFPETTLLCFDLNVIKRG